MKTFGRQHVTFCCFYRLLISNEKISLKMYSEQKKRHLAITTQQVSELPRSEATMTD